MGLHCEPTIDRRPEHAAAVRQGHLLRDPTGAVDGISDNQGGRQVWYSESAATSQNLGRSSNHWEAGTTAKHRPPRHLYIIPVTFFIECPQQEVQIQTTPGYLCGFRGRCGGVYQEGHKPRRPDGAASKFHRWSPSSSLPAWSLKLEA